MSFVRLDSGEFPPLNKASQSKTFTNNQPIKQTNGHIDSKKAEQNSINSLKKRRQDGSRNDRIFDSNDFVRCRVGFQLHEYTDDLDHVIKSQHIGECGDFILAPITSYEPFDSDNEFNAIPDLALPGELWQTKVAIHIGHPRMDVYDASSARSFDKLFRHALYLSAPVIVISCPNSELAYISIASTINERLSETPSMPLVLFKVPVTDQYQSYVSPNPWFPEITQQIENTIDNFEPDKNPLHRADNHLTSESYSSGESGYGYSNNSQDKNRITSFQSWNQWNNIRSHLLPDSRIGVCLFIDDDLDGDDEDLARWRGEPVRMVILSRDQFVRSPGHNGALRLNIACREFVERLAIANSLKVSFVIDCPNNQDVKEYLLYLDQMSESIREQNQDYLLSWHDKIQPPLQPLSTNLDSSTYGVFEMDSVKYKTYRDAMIEAIRKLLLEKGSNNREFVLMVLGAGRGPLVDSYISAIRALDTKDYRFKIYALDKNPSSVRSLLYKQKHHWVDPSGTFTTDVVEADMRCWQPGHKADVITTELLGSLADNELSPECIDGVWKFSTPATISIPQRYASYIAPICSFKLHQELFKLVNIGERYAYDRIYVVKLTNYYSISRPQQLFAFEHRDLSLPPSTRCNERYTRLNFWSKVDTVCHGFAGYFTADLYGQVSLSTLLGAETPNMDSWFPAFIPLENPIPMPRGTKLEVHFWRKESASSVWYQWVVTRPVRSRFYSQNGLKTAMSKSV